MQLLPCDLSIPGAHSPPVKFSECERPGHLGQNATNFHSAVIPVGDLCVGQLRPGRVLSAGRGVCSDAQVFAQMLTLCKVCLFAVGLDSFMSKGAVGSLPLCLGLTPP